MIARLFRPFPYHPTEEPYPLPTPKLDPAFLSAAELAERIHRGELSAVAAVDALAERIDALNPKLNAYAHLDWDAARKEAAERDARQKKEPHKRHGPLFGVPVAVKDDLGAVGFPTTMGSQVTPRDKATADDITVSRLRAAGAVVIGKTHEPEFGHKGTTNNRLGPGGATLATATPWDLSKTAGGSSGGSAAAVAAGLAYLALGTDIGGSVRIPAACCGAVGLKPTFGTIPRVPSGNAFTLWVSGPIARTVADVALAMEVLAGPDPRDRFSLPHLPADMWEVCKKLGAPRMVWSARPTGGPVDPEVAAIGLAAARRLARAAGTRLAEPNDPLIPRAEAKELLKHLEVVFAAGALGEFVAYTPHKDRKAFEKVKPDLSPSFVRLVEPAWETTLAGYAAAQAGITAFCEGRGARLFDGYDLVVTPTISVPPFDKALDRGPDQVAGEKIDDHLEWHLSWPFNLTGDPAVSVPCGWTEAGLPVGLQIAARRGHDGLALRAAAAVERETPRRPLPAEIIAAGKPKGK